MEKCKLKRGDRIYECQGGLSTLTELTTDPELTVHDSGARYWHWQARVVTGGSGRVEPGTVLNYGITEGAAGYGPRLYRQDFYDVGYAAERVLPPFDTTHEVELRRVCVADDVELLGHVFHGLADIKAHVEMSLYKGLRHGRARAVEPRACCDVHVGELWSPYPCFDADDAASENRTFQNFVFRRSPISHDDMQALSELPSQSNDCRVAQLMPAHLLPVVYYPGDGSTMLVAL